MSRTIDYYFSMVSPWAYIGHEPFMAIARKHGATVRFKPVSLGEVFAETGGLPLPKRAPPRQRYRFLELQRWRERRGLAFALQPKHWPFDGRLADKFVVAIVAAGLDPDPFLRLGFAGVWEKEIDLGDEAVIARLAQDAGLDARPLLAAAKGPDAEAAYKRNFSDALAADVFGSPSYVVDGEVFWGQDRLDLLDAMLTSGRAAYKPAA
jgi:2-hydroxychromene-2-carboxylate isomerase